MDAEQLIANCSETICLQIPREKIPKTAEETIAGQPFDLVRIRLMVSTFFDDCDGVNWK